MVVKLLPVCECGYIFREGIEITKNINEVKGSNDHIKYGTYNINPPKCPNCKQIIEGVLYNNYIIN